jgi:hypothetical protein
MKTHKTKEMNRRGPCEAKRRRKQEEEEEELFFCDCIAGILLLCHDECALVDWC